MRLLLNSIAAVDYLEWHFRRTYVIKVIIGSLYVSFNDAFLSIFREESPGPLPLALFGHKDTAQIEEDITTVNGFLYISHHTSHSR
jgi:hypothetical protein